MTKYPYISIPAATILAIIGAATVFMGGAVLFDFFGMRALEGNYVSFVVMANWICGFIYLVAAYGFWKQKIWTEKLLWLSFLILVIAFAGFINHIYLGGLYETKTIYAMSFRSLLSLIMAILAHFIIRKK